MKRDLELKLANKFPELFRDLDGDPQKTLMNYGCDIGDGWYKLLEECCQKLVDSKCDVILVQVKEKFAILTIYIHARIEGKEIPEEAFQICRDAAKASQTICEHCGAPGYIRRDSRFWIKTLCNECDIKFLAE